MRPLILRTLILSATMVMASATVQAGDLRSLSTGLATDTPAERPAPAPSAMRANNDTPATEAPRYAPPPPPPPAATTTQNEPSRNTSDTPRYSTRPAVEPATTATTPPATTTPSTADRYTPRSEPSYHPSPSRMRYRPAHMNQRYASIRWPRPHLPHRWSTGRVIAALHRYGIYW